MLKAVFLPLSCYFFDSFPHLPFTAWGYSPCDVISSIPTPDLTVVDEYHHGLVFGPLRINAESANESMISMYTSQHFIFLIFLYLDQSLHAR